MNILDQWGDSDACDRIRAQVSALAPDKRAGRIFMVLQCYADESKSPGRHFVIAGYIGTAEEWAKFSAEWSPLAREWGVLLKNKTMRVFKMQEMMALEERRERIPAFFRVIENRKLMPFSFGVNLDVFDRCASQIRVLDRGTLRYFDKLNHYHFLFNCIVSNVVRLVNRRTDLFSQDEKIDFYFDEQAGIKRHILESWPDFVETSDKSFSTRIGITPRFEHEEEFMPLQAADFWAWLSSHWEDKGEHSLDGIVDIKKEISAARALPDARETSRILRNIVRSQYPQSVIYDVSFDLKPSG